MSTSLQTLVQNCARRCGWYATASPNTASTASTYFALNQASSQFDSIDDSAYYKDNWVKVESDGAATALNVGEVRRVSSYATASSIFTLSRGFTNNPTTTQVMGLYKGVPPTQWAMLPGWKEYINRALVGVRYRRHSLLTRVTDGDMETSGTTTWTGANSTLTKTTTAASVSFGAQALRVANSSANGYAKCGAIAVVGEDVYQLRADVKVASGTGVLVAYDETNGADIDTKSSSAADWRYIWFQFTVPSTCKSITIRLRGTEASADVYWDNVSLRHNSAKRFALPSWLDNRDKFEGLVQMRGDSAQSDAYLADSQIPTDLVDYRLLEDPTGATRFYVDFTEAPSYDALLFVRGLCPYAELSTDSDTTQADPALVSAGARFFAHLDVGPTEKAQQALLEYNGHLSALPRTRKIIPRLR